MLESAIGITCVAWTFQEDRFEFDLRAFPEKKHALAREHQGDLRDEAMLGSWPLIQARHAY
jgi:hypothetical protein